MSGSSAAIVRASRVEITLRSGEQVVRGRGLQDFERFALALPTPAHRLVASDPGREAGDALAFELFAREEVDSRPFELGAADGFAAQPIRLFDDPPRRFEQAGRVGLEADREEAAIQRRVGTGVDEVDEARVLADALDEPARLAFSEHVGEQVEVDGLALLESRGGPGNVDAMALEGATQDGHADPVPGRLRRPASSPASPRGASAKRRSISAATSFASKSPTATTIRLSGVYQRSKKRRTWLRSKPATFEAGPRIGWP